ncbi:MAG: DNA polymerase III subunit beta [Clostridiales bacterium]|nr:DNA polymerase III subunit beta [Clostridiales bacterium]MCF8023316.1 DNA polymerase III subunit beta [Clostridiales bacterium]
MQFSVDKKVLESALYAATQAVPNNTSPLPVLSGIYLSANYSGVQVLGTDLNITVNTEMEAEIVDEGEAIIPAKRFYELVKSMRSCTVTVRKESETSAVIEYEKNSFRIHVYDEEFPVTPEPENPTTIELDAKTFLSAAKKVSLAASEDEVYAVFSGVLLDATPFDFNLVATDRHRLNWQVLEGGDDETSVVVPKNSIEKAMRLLKSDRIEITAGDNLVKFHSGGINIYAKTLSGKFPDYSKIVPLKFEAEVKVNSEEFLDTLKRASLLTSNLAKISKVHLKTKDGILYVDAEDEKSEVNEKLEIQHEGDIDVFFNTRYLLDSLSVVDGSETVIKFKGNMAKIEEEDFCSMVVGIVTEEAEAAS